VIDQQTGLPNQTTTEVTTNVMVRDGTTVVIGGLIEEQVVESYERVPLLGAMPVVGRVFRNKSESIVRSELIVLITPRIVREPAEVEEGNTVAFENDRRHEGFRDNLAAINRRNLARIHFERALLFFEKGELDKALHHVEKSLLQNKNSLDSLRLQEDILAALQQRRPEWMRVPWESESSEQAVEPALP
jgi:type IV pilus assembly protein PilQ